MWLRKRFVLYLIYTSFFVNLLCYDNLQYNESLIYLYKKDLINTNRLYQGQIITSDMIRSETAALDNSYVGICKIQDNRIDILSKHPEAFLGRKEQFRHMLEEVARRRKIPDIEFLISFADEPCETKNCVSFCISTNSDNNRLIGFPDFSIFEHISPGLDILINSANQPLWSEKSNKLYWRGSLTGFDINNIELSNRVNICLLSLKNPSMLDAKISNFVSEESSRLIHQKYPQIISDRADKQDYLKHKYILSIKGWTASTLLHWALFSNSVVFKQEYEFRHYFENKLKPFIHYIPVKPDLSDIFEKYKWAENNQDKCLEIIRNANNFAKDNLNPEAIYSYIGEILDEYAKIYRQ